VFFQFQRCDNDPIIMLRAGWTFKDKVSLSGSTIAYLSNARHLRTVAIIVLMYRVFARHFILLASTVGFVACGSDSATGPTGGFTGQIDVRYLSDITPALQTAVTNATARWTRALSKNLGDFPINLPANSCFPGQPPINETHHNLLLFVSVADIDGPGTALALTSVCMLSSRDTLPILSKMVFDRADLDSMDASGTLQGVVMHEMGHTLGFHPGTYVTKGLSGGGTSDPFFSGVTARSEFAKHGAWYTGVTVPLEDARGLGPMDPHWRVSVFGDELMISFVGRGLKSPLSSITLGFFQDIGYNVDFSVADPYEVAPFFVGNRIVPEGSLANDFQQITPPKFVSPLVVR
jgi:Leishmanolysin